MAAIGADLRGLEAGVVLLLRFLALADVALQLLQLRRSHPAAQVGDRIVAGDHLRALMASRQKVAAPGLRAGIGCFRGDDNEGWQVAIDRAQPVAHPGPYARPREVPRSAMHAERALVMVRMIRFHRTDHAQIIDNASHVREQIADFDT